MGFYTAYMRADTATKYFSAFVVVDEFSSARICGNSLAESSYFRLLSITTSVVCSHVVGLPDTTSWGSSGSVAGRIAVIVLHSGKALYVYVML